ncbi:hypothetical protein [Pseudoxanthomonas mexicana]
MFVLFLAGSSSAAQAKDAPTDFLGITVGSELSVPECGKDLEGEALAKRMRVKGLRPTYAALSDVTCWRHYSDFGVGEPLTDRVTSVKLVVPFDKRPAGVVDVSLSLKARTVTSITLSTNGHRSQDSFSALLREKYGMPTESTNATLSNLYGASVESVVASWTFDNIVVDFMGVAGRIDEGMIIVKTRAAADAQAESAASQNKIKL